MARRESAHTRGFLALLALLTLLVLGALTGLFGWISEEIDAMGVGDLGTWVSGLATAAVAVAAVRAQHSANVAAREAATTAAETLSDKRTEEARKVDWWFEDVVHGDAITDDLSVQPLPLPPDLHPMAVPKVQYDSYAVLRVVNNNASSVIDARIQLKGQAFPKHRSHDPSELVRIRPGVTRYWVSIGNRLTPSAYRFAIANLRGNYYAEWLEFRDSYEVLWRRDANGNLKGRVG